MRKGEKKLIEEYRKIEEKPQNLEKLKELLMVFLDKGMDNYIIDISHKIIRLDPRSIKFILSSLDDYTLDYVRKRDYPRARRFIRGAVRDWRKFEIEHGITQAQYAKDLCIISAEVDWIFYLTKAQDSLAKFKRDEAIDWSHNYGLGIIYLARMRYRDAFLKFQKAVEILYKFRRRKIKDKSFRPMSLNKENIEQTYLRTKMFYKLSKGLLNLFEFNFDNARKDFIRLGTMIKKSNEPYFYPMLKLAKIVEIDERIALLRDNENFEQLQKSILEVLKKLDKVMYAEEVGQILRPILACKQTCLMVLSNSIVPGFVEYYQKATKTRFRKEKPNKILRRAFDLDYAREFFKSVKLTRFQQFANRLENFVLEVGRYSSPKEVPIDEQGRLISSLGPFFDMIDGRLTTQAMPEFQKQMLRQQIEAKEILLKIEDSVFELPKKIGKLFKKEEIKEAKFKPQEAKEEKIEYEIWMPIENNEGCECEKVNQSVVEERFEELRKGHKLFIDNRYRYIYINGKKVDMVTIARRNKKTKKIKHEEVKISFIKYNLLIWFLQNKDKLFNHERLYKIGWSNPDKRTEEVDLGVRYKESLKNQISILNGIFKALGLSKNLKIESERPLGYYCEGNCDFRILKKINPENISL